MKKKPSLHLCKKSETLQLPHLIELRLNLSVIPTRVMDGFNTLYAYTEYRFQTVRANIMWVKEFGVN